MNPYRQRAVFLVVFVAMCCFLGTGLTAADWTHKTEDGYEVYYWNTTNYRFRYNYAATQWQHYSAFGGWHDLSATGMTATFIGDGGPYDLKNGLKYAYNSATHNGFFFRSAQYRFYYNYLAGHWYTSGYGGGWHALGGPSRSAESMADTTATSLGNGLSFSYNASYDYGYYQRGVQWRFYYKYGIGQWYTSGYAGGWHALGGPQCSAEVMADTTPTLLDNGLSFSYNASNDYGYYQRVGHWRFYYKYGVGQWYTSGYAGGWYALGGPQRNAEVMADTTPTLLDSGLSFSYNAPYDYGYYRRGAQWRFYYKYLQGQWYHSGFGGGWFALGAPARTAGALCEQGIWELGLGPDLSYRYNPTYDFGFFNEGDSYRFYYRYGTGQWYNSGWGGGWYALGAAGLSAAVMADGEGHDLGDGWSFTFYQSELLATWGYWCGSWKRDGADLYFAYSYQQGLWTHQGAYGSEYELNGAPLHAQFIADSLLHDLKDGWGFEFHQVGGKGQNYGRWVQYAATYIQFYYFYVTGQWKHEGAYGDVAVLGPAGLSADFIADETSHDLKDGWSYRFFKQGTQGYNYGRWQRDAALWVWFYYYYTFGDWWHQGQFGQREPLSQDCLSTAFIGNGDLYVLWLPNSHGNLVRWDYRFYEDGFQGENYGVWHVPDSDYIRFYYLYEDGQWKHEGEYGAAYNLGPDGKGSSLIFDHAAHNLGNGWGYQFDDHAYTVGPMAIWYRYAPDGSYIFIDFLYSYRTGQWAHEQKLYGPHHIFTAVGLPAEFVADGSPHDLKNGWHFRFDNDDNTGWWQPDEWSCDKWMYEYELGQWWRRYVPGGAWSTWGDSGSDTTFPE